MCHGFLPTSAFDVAKQGGRLKVFCRGCCRQLSKQSKLAASRKNGTLGQNYSGRDDWLRLMGFQSYREYLASPLWSEVRKRVFYFKGRICYLCGKAATQVHHTRYHKNDLSGRKLKFLFPICGECHSEIEFDIDGEGRKKLTLRGANFKFRTRHRARKVELRQQSVGEPALDAEFRAIIG
jgi:hypothetical protein